MRVCPQCGYIDDYTWRPKIWHTHSEIEICRLCDLEIISPKLALRLKTEPTACDEYYAYRISRTGIWVYRRPLIIYKIQGWKDIPAEMHKKPKNGVLS